MKRKLFFVLVFSIFVCSSFYSNDKKVTIFLEEYNYVFTPQKTGCIYTLVEKLENGRLEILQPEPPLDQIFQPPSK